MRPIIMQKIMATTPVIDLGGPLDRTARALGDASEGLGFYFVRKHGVPQSLIDRMFRETERFHSLPLEKKLAVRIATTHGVRSTLRDNAVNNIWEAKRYGITSSGRGGWYPCGRGAT